jgi:hypothetical protein
LEDIIVGDNVGSRRSTHCKDCGENLNINPVYSTNKNNTWRLTRCRKCNNVYQREIQAANPSATRSMQLKYNYGISVEDYNKLLEFQDGVCAVCKQSSDKNFHVDHNHVTGEVRGLLCQACNKAIGFLKEDPNIFLSAYEYMERTTWNKGLELVRIREKKIG